MSPLYIYRAEDMTSTDLAGPSTFPQRGSAFWQPCIAYGNGANTVKARNPQTFADLIFAPERKDVNLGKTAGGGFSCVYVLRMHACTQAADSGC